MAGKGEAGVQDDLRFSSLLNNDAALRLTGLDHNLTSNDRIKYCGLSNPLEEKFPKEKGVPGAGKEK